MSDPVYQKLMSDAGVLLADLWHALKHQSPSEERLPERQHAIEQLPLVELKPVDARSCGLCYFHLN